MNANPSPTKQNLPGVSRKPKVMIVIATDIIGGPGKGLFQFLKFADHDKFDYMLCNYAPASIRQLRGRTLIYDFVNKAEEEGHTIHWLYQRSKIDPSLILQARRMIRQYGIDIVQTHGYKSNVLGCMLKLLYGMPWIAFAHGYTDENSKMALYKRIDLFCYRFADLAVVVSDPLRQLLISKGTRAERVIKLHNAVDPDEMVSNQDPEGFRRILGIPRSNKTIGVIGRLSPEKGQLVFLKAFQKVRRQFDGVTALLIGDGQDKPELQQFCSKHRLQSDVIFTGHVTNIGDYFRALDIVVIPSYSEGLPNVLLEAMVLGIPAVATRVGAIGEVLEGMTTNMVPPGEPDAMADKIIRLLSDSDLYSRISVQGREIIASRFNPSGRAQTLVGLYDRIKSASAKEIRQAGYGQGGS